MGREVTGIQKPCELPGFAGKGKEGFVIGLSAGAISFMRSVGPKTSVNLEKAVGIAAKEPNAAGTAATMPWSAASSRRSAQATCRHRTDERMGRVRFRIAHRDIEPRASVMDCASPLALSIASARPKAPEDRRSPKPRGRTDGSWKGSGPLNAALPDRRVGQAPKAVTSHRSPNLCCPCATFHHCGTARRSRNRTECIRPRAQQLSSVRRAHTIPVLLQHRTLLRSGTVALRELAAREQRAQKQGSPNDQAGWGIGH